MFNVHDFTCKTEQRFRYFFSQGVLYNYYSQNIIYSPHPTLPWSARQDHTIKLIQLVDLIN